MRAAILRVAPRDMPATLLLMLLRYNSRRRKRRGRIVSSRRRRSSSSSRGGMRAGAHRRPAVVGAVRPVRSFHGRAAVHLAAARAPRVFIVAEPVNQVQVRSIAGRGRRVGRRRRRGRPVTYADRDGPAVARNRPVACPAAVPGCGGRRPVKQPARDAGLAAGPPPAMVLVTKDICLLVHRHPGHCCRPRQRTRRGGSAPQGWRRGQQAAIAARASVLRGAHCGRALAGWPPRLSIETRALGCAACHGHISRVGWLIAFVHSAAAVGWKFIYRPVA